MDAASALADLLELSSQLEAAVLVDSAGAVTASTIASEAGSERLARAGVRLLAEAEERFTGGGRRLTQLEIALREGSIFAVRGDARTIVARSSPGPSSQLVFSDLRACLRATAPAKPRSRKAKKSVEETAGA